MSIIKALVDIRNQISKNNLLSTLVYFYSKEYCSLLSWYLRNFLVNSTENKFNILSLEDSTEQKFNAELYVSFLGNNTYYWVVTRLALLAGKQARFKNYILNYDGPHSLFLYDTLGTSGQDDLLAIKNKQHCFIKFPEKVNRILYKDLYMLLFNSSTFNNTFVDFLFRNKEYISLEDACQFMGYQSVIGSNSKKFFMLWSPYITKSEKSLFLLSQYFFERNKRLFFDYWIKIFQDYPVEFWIAFFSDLLWQAVIFLEHANTKNLNNFKASFSKKQFTRLPFSFINKDWKKYSSAFLQQAHADLYTIDYNHKNNLNSYKLEIWYNKFFLKKF